MTTMELGRKCLCLRDWRARHRKGFTIVELLVATAVLALILALLLQIVNHTLQASKLASQQLDATQSARRALDMITSDLAHAVVSESSTVIYRDTPVLAFLRHGRGSSAGDAPRFLGVNYQLVNNSLMRGYSNVPWSAVDFLTAASQNPTVSSELSTGILQFSVLASLEDGTVSTLASLPSSTVASGTVLYKGQTVPAGWSALIPVHSPTGSSPRVQSLLILIAAIDEQNYKILPAEARDIFPQPTATADPVGDWERILAAAEMPSPARAAIRFHSKVVPLP